MTPPKSANSIWWPNASSRTASTCRWRKAGSPGRSGHAVHRHRFRPRIDDPIRLRAHRQTLAARHAALSAAETLYEAQPEDMAVFAYHDRTPGFERDFVGRSLDFYRRDYFLLMQDGRQKNRYPGRRRAGHASGMAADQTEQRLGVWAASVIRPARCWRPTSMTIWRASASCSCCCLPDGGAGAERLQRRPDHLILSIMDNVVNRLEVLTPQGGSWQRRPLGNPAPSAPFPPAASTKEQRLFPDRQRVPAADFAVHGQSRRR